MERITIDGDVEVYEFAGEATLLRRGDAAYIDLSRHDATKLRDWLTVFLRGYAKPVDPLASMYPTRAVYAALNRRDAEMRERMSAQKAAIEREAFDTKPVEDQRTIKAGEWKPATEAELREAIDAAIAGLARIKGGDLS